MATQRFLTAVLETAEVTQVTMPWMRGARKVALIDKRALKAGNKAA